MTDQERRDLVEAFLREYPELPQPPAKKKWWFSKTIWAAIITIAFAVAKAFGIEIPDTVTEALIGLGLLFVRTSKQDLT